MRSLIDYVVFERLKQRVLVRPTQHQHNLFFVDAETSQAIMKKVADGEIGGFDVGDIIDQYDKHAYFQVDLSWTSYPSQVYGAVTARKREVNEKAMAPHRKEKTEEPDTWLFCEFSTNKLIGEAASMVMRVVCGFILRSIINRPELVIQTNGQRSVTERSKGKPRYVTVLLSDAGKRYVHSSEHGTGGWKMPEHEVRGHMRTLSDGRQVFVRGHKRGDPAIERKTLGTNIRL